MKTKLYKIFDEIKNINYACWVMNWDQMTGAPKSGAAKRTDSLTYLSMLAHSKFTSKETGELLKAALSGELSELERIDLTKIKKKYDEETLLPIEFVEEFTRCASESTTAWEDAYHKSDYSLYKPFLQKIVDLQRKRAKLLGYEGREYEYFLGLYEDGMSIKVLDEFFTKFKQGLLPILKSVLDSQNEIPLYYINSTVTEQIQAKVSTELLGLIGFDLTKGYFKSSTHPFTMGLSTRDVRLTTKYLENMPFSSIYSTIHEGGHGIFEQNVSSDLEKYASISLTDSMGIHESQSKIYETIFGLSREFMTPLAKVLSKYPEYYEGISGEDGKALQQVDPKKLYLQLNHIKPSLIRVEADELTYPLHIIIRYELEKSLFDGSLSVDDLADAWNAKYQEYLGITPTKEQDGVLQDIHWSDGSFGYFPTYALGIAYAAQFAHKMSQSFDYKKDIENGDFSNIVRWLQGNIHQHGSIYKPLELLEKVTNESLNPDYLINYFQQKYSNIFKF